jgi:hypothetical protein
MKLVQALEYDRMQIDLSNNYLPYDAGKIQQKLEHVAIKGLEGSKRTQR